jgi:D-3-phosphoglycerate dehydrogenase / 2-oxoglutarate reductase
VSGRLKVLVAEKLAVSGVDALREHFDVELGHDWDRAQLESRIGEFHGLVIRSATQVDAALIEKADNLRVIGRAGVGVDNVDTDAATKRGIIVANAPQSNIVAAAEHTLALLLALARNVPQAHRSLQEGRWERAKYGGVEVQEKVLGILGFGRIGQLVAARARAFGMHVLAYDPYVAAERFRELGAEQAPTTDDVLARADFLTIHLPNTPETKGFLNADRLAACKDGVRIINCARGSLVVDDDLRAAIDSGKVAGAALDVFQTEPITEHPLFGYPNVVVTPHLGASTAEAQDRAGVQTAEQVVAALTGGVVSTAVNIPAIPPEDMEVLGPFLPLCQALGRIAVKVAGAVERVEVEFLGRVAERDTRLLTLAVLQGVLQDHTEEDVNLVNAPTIADERGIDLIESKSTQARDFADLIRVTVAAGPARERVVGTVVGRRARPHLLEAWGQRFNLQMDDHVVLLRYDDVPGMIGRVGTLLGEAGININQMVVGRGKEDDDLAVMVITTDAPVPHHIRDQIDALPGFREGRAISL